MPTPYTYMEGELPKPLFEDSGGEFGIDQLWPTAMSESERRQVHLDIYGHQSFIDALVEKRIAAIEQELGCLPFNSKQSLVKAQKLNPLLLTTSPRVKHLVLDPGFDPRVAAGRLTKYWEMRELIFGARAFSDEVFDNPSYEDYVYFYEKMVKAASNPESDDSTRMLATEYVCCANAAKIRALDAAIEEIPAHEKTALVQKNTLDSTSEKEKLAFLLAENLVEKKAAQRLVNYWDIKSRLFGDSHALNSKITLNSLEEHMSSVALGAVRVLPSTDSSGRSVILWWSHKLIEGLGSWTEKGFLIAVWYAFQTAIERESCKKNGVVIIVNAEGLCGGDAFRLRSLRRKYIEIMFKCFPTKVKAIHVCGLGLPAWLQHSLCLFLNQVGGTLVGRILVHSGNQEEVVVKMEEFGITKKQIPVELGGDVGMEQWGAWLEERKSLGL